MDSEGSNKRKGRPAIAAERKRPAREDEYLEHVFEMAYADSEPLLIVPTDEQRLQTDVLWVLRYVPGPIREAYAISSDPDDCGGTRTMGVPYTFEAVDFALTLLQGCVSPHAAVSKLVDRMGAKRVPYVLAETFDFLEWLGLSNTRQCFATALSTKGGYYWNSPELRVEYLYAFALRRLEMDATYSKMVEHVAGDMKAHKKYIQEKHKKVLQEQGVFEMLAMKQLGA